jgi:hypothetical protein
MALGDRAGGGHRVLADPVIAKLVGYSSALFRTVLVRDCLVGLWALSRRQSGSQLLDGAFSRGVSSR